MDTAAMVKPFNCTIRVIFGNKDIGSIWTGACDRKTIKRRRARKITGNIEAVSAINCDGICAIRLVADSTSAVTVG
jgi:hypothetical protein